MYLGPRTGLNLTHKIQMMPTTLALRNPYARNYALTVGAKRARIAYAGASYLYRHRKGVYGAAKVIGRAYKRYRSRASAKKEIAGRHRIGERNHKTVCKRTTIVDTNVLDRNTRTLYQVNLTTIAKNVGTDDIDRRDRNMANIRGFKLHLHVRNTTQHVMCWNLAIVSPKDDSNSAVNVTNFFRGTGTERGIDFNFSILNSNDFRSRHLNTDKFNILMHKRYKLHPLTQGAGLYTVGSGKNWMVFDRYIPLKRQLRYDSNASTTPFAGHCYYIYWFDGLMEDTGSLPINLALRYQERIVTVFKDPKT